MGCISTVVLHYVMRYEDVSESFIYTLGDTIHTSLSLLWI